MEQSLSPQFKKQGEGVFHASTGIVSISQADMSTLSQEVPHTKLKRARYCTHQKIEDGLHEMFIIHQKNAYIRPHRHLGRAESSHVISGEADFLIFDEDGKIQKIHKLGDYQSKKDFYIRLSEPCFHTMIIRSDFFAFHEVSTGPFDPSTTEFASWAPEGNSELENAAFLTKLSEQVSKLS